MYLPFDVRTQLLHILASSATSNHHNVGGKQHRQVIWLCTWREFWKLLVPLVIGAIVVERLLEVRVEVQQLRLVLQASNGVLSDMLSC